ncbi:hypothetical protein Y032_0152g2863 [Ancylostoma ceylanicum]|uniref:Uncharacterized protein n=1 Tax=Ancylostoma ceylanicum TaxID=53326 RepID=A0A016T0E9_9BILA|nr:hypothetical protein Y032_0152g2863 [Ancylostoma ceylanicum]
MQQGNKWLFLDRWRTIAKVLVQHYIITTSCSSLHEELLTDAHLSVNSNVNSVFSKVSSTSTHFMRMTM